MTLQRYQRHQEFPLTDDQWDRMQKEIMKEASRLLVSRRFIDIYGPLGSGLESISYETFDKDELAEIDLEGGKDSRAIGPKNEVYRRVPLVYKDFVLHWRDVELSRTMNFPLDVSRAIRAAHFVADREDELILCGEEKLGIEGLMNAKGRNTEHLSDWSKFGNPFKDVLRATECLLKLNHHRPYALVLSPHLYSQLLKMKDNSPFLELDQLSKLCIDGVFQSPSLEGEKGVVISTGPQNIDIAVAEDWNVAFLGSESMNYIFRIYESLVLRIKRPTAICTLEKSLK